MVLRSLSHQKPRCGRCPATNSRSLLAAELRPPWLPTDHLPETAGQGIQWSPGIARGCGPRNLVSDHTPVTSRPTGRSNRPEPPRRGPSPQEGPIVSDTTDLLDPPATGSAADGSSDSSETKPARKRSAGLSGMVLAELQGLAGELGISGTAKMRKGQLIEAIKERQSGSSDAPAASRAARHPRSPGGDPPRGRARRRGAGREPAHRRREPQHASSPTTRRPRRPATAPGPLGPRTARDRATAVPPRPQSGDQQSRRPAVRRPAVGSPAG